MIGKRFGTLAACLALACGLLTIPAAAETAPGVYTASMVTTYYNPDTGNVDDGGSANAALGEGMCRSATDRTALVEVDENGRVWVTVRLLLQSNCSNVAFYTRSGYDSYSQVSYDIIAEDAANDSIDYRFQVSEAGQTLKCTMYVAPMGRDVLWYLYVDTGTLTSGNGDFVVSIDTSSLNAEPAAPVETVPSEPASAPAPVPESESTEATPPGAPEENPEEAPADLEPAGNTSAPQEDAAPEEHTEPEEIQRPEEDTPAVPDTDESAGQNENTPDSNAPSGESRGPSVGTTAGIVVLVLLAAGAAAYFVKRKKST